MKKKSWVLLAGVLCMGTAFAQEPEEEEPLPADPWEDPSVTGVPPAETDQPAAIEEDESMFTEVEPAEPEAYESEANKPDLQGVTVMAGGGVEGYTGDFGSTINPGVGWSVVADLKPWKALGLELGYTGAVNDLDRDFAGSQEGAVNGADIVRNGGHAAVTVGLPTTLQPYVLAGIGIDRYQFRGAEGDRGFSDDTSGSVPLGIGLRTHAGDFTADLRAGYDVLFGDDFSPVTDTNVTEGRLKGVLQIGGTF